jgi:uncharacterized coiled-coil protein SlyX
MMWRPDPKNQNARLTAYAVEEKQKTIEALQDDVTELRNQLDESSKHIAKLQARLNDARLRHSDNQSDARLSARDGLAREAARQLPADIYETSRATSVYEEPSEFSRRVATITEGTIVTVVGYSGEWLQIRSRHGKPPGFIRREDIRLVRKSERISFTLSAG